MKWVPCSERVPEIGVAVLIWVRGPNGGTAAVAVLDPDWGETPVWVCPSDFCPRWDVDDVTHWMPLPEGPQ
jgi:hypothetical protein